MNWNGLFVAKHPDVYEPSDDTFLLAEAVIQDVLPGERFVEVGCGAGLVAIAAARAGAKVIATDRNPRATDLTRHNARENALQVDAVVTDLLAAVSGPIDVVAFNPPYLPTAEGEHVDGALDWAFDGGLDGNVVALQFAEQVAVLKPRRVLVVHSSLSDPGPLIDRMDVAGYRHDVAADLRLPYERLYVRRFRR